MGHYVFLGQEPGATLDYDPVSKFVRWNAPGYIDVQVYVNGELFSSGEYGRESAAHFPSGQPYEFKLIARRAPGETSAYLATVMVDANGIVSGTTVAGGEIPPPSAGDGARMSLSWFDQSTVILGSAIPNLYLVAGGGLIVLAAMAAKKR